MHQSRPVHPGGFFIAVFLRRFIVQNPMAQNNSKLAVEEMLSGIDFQHLRDGGKWLSNQSFDRLCFYAKELRKLGMLDGEISCMLADLYWDAVEEYTLNKQALPVVAIPPATPGSAPLN